MNTIKLVCMSYSELARFETVTVAYSISVAVRIFKYGWTDDVTLSMTQPYLYS